MKNNKKQETMFERLQKSFNIEYYKKEGINDNIILNFVKRNKEKNISENLIKTNLNERLKAYEFFLNTLRNYSYLKLDEETGVPDCIHYIKDTIISYIKNYIREHRNTIFEGEVFKIHIPNAIFDSNKVFFNDCKIIFEMSLYVTKYPKQTTDKLMSEYKDFNSVLKFFNISKKQETKLVNGEFIFRVCEFESEWIEAASKVIYHEFLHAYQDYNMLLYNQNYKNSKNYLATKIMYTFTNDMYKDILSNPQKYKDDYGEYSELVIDCCNAVYILTKMEQNAYISQAYSEINDYISRKRNFTYEEVIENTTIYEYMYNLIIFLEELKSTDEEGVTCVGFIMAAIKRGKVNNEKECTKEYNELIKRIERTINSVYAKLTRLLGNYCSTKNVLGTHGKMSGLYKRMINLNKK